MILLERPGAEKCYLLLPPGEYWRQLLIFPAVGLARDEVELYQVASGCLLWIELVSGKVWNLVSRRCGPVLPIKKLELLARCLEGAHLDELPAVLSHLANLLNWQELEGPDPQAHRLIAGELAKVQLHAGLNPAEEDPAGGLLLPDACRPYLASYEQGSAAFIAALDREALALTDSGALCNGDDLLVYNHLMAPLAKIRKYRRQALQAVPLLRGPLASGSTEFRVRRLQQCVDAGNLLLPVLSDYFRAPFPVVGFLQGKDFALIGEQWRGELDLLVDILCRVKPGCWPRETEDWRQLASLVLPVCQALDGLRKAESQERLVRCLNDLARDGFASLPKRIRRYGVSSADIIAVPDFEREFCEWAVLAGVDQGGACEALWSYSIFKIAILTRRWREWRQDEGRKEAEEPESQQARPPWPHDRVERFRELLHGYPLLEKLA